MCSPIVASAALRLSEEQHCAFSIGDVAACVACLHLAGNLQVAVVVAGLIDAATVVDCLIATSWHKARSRDTATGELTYQHFWQDWSSPGHGTLEYLDAALRMVLALHCKGLKTTTLLCSRSNQHQTRVDCV
jgi:hypothetical protein